jgi:hypothetical protein
MCNFIICALIIFRQAVNVSVEIITIMDDMAPDQTSARVVVEVTPPRHVEGVGAFRFTQVEAIIAIN